MKFDWKDPFTKQTIIFISIVSIFTISICIYTIIVLHE
jgi:hypothetical protein